MHHFFRSARYCEVPGGLNRTSAEEMMLLKMRQSVTLLVKDMGEIHQSCILLQEDGRSEFEDHAEERRY